MAMRWRDFREENASNFLLYDRDGGLLWTGWEFSPNFNPEIIDVVTDPEMNCKRVLLDFVPPDKEKLVAEEELGLRESFHKASERLKMAMEALQDNGFSREEAFELIKGGAFISYVNHYNLSNIGCAV